MAAALHQRLLHDVHELQAKPYPNIRLHIHDDEITEACLILTAEGYGPMHLTVYIPPQYPLSPPTISMDSDIKHPNIYGSYICASILNTQDGYTPAYTLKGIAIQLLSFFSSERIEQTDGGYHRDLDKYRQLQSHVSDTYICTECGFGTGNTTTSNGSRSPRNKVAPPPPRVGTDPAWPTPQESTVIGNKGVLNTKLAYIPQSILDKCAGGCASTGAETPASDDASRGKTGIQNVPDEILLLICDKLETEDLMVFAEAWDNIGLLMTNYDIIRTRELQCFIFKQDYTETELGVGVSVAHRGRMGTFESEFDLLSQKAFGTHGHRWSTQAIPFQYWLPLPLSYGHWKRVKGQVPRSLSILGQAATLGSTLPSKVIFHFMNDIVVKLNEHTTQSSPIRHHYAPQSTLTHASEKAIESYFHLFHLLLCLVTTQPSIVDSANNLLRSFMQGNTSKASCPNLGHLLVAALISDVDMTENLLRAIIKETVTRNVVWMLDKKGANMPELAYMEPSAVSHYRLEKTFEASKTSYRLLMFLSLFQRTAVGSPRKPLNQLRDEAFERHGAPPRGSAKGLAESIKRIHQIETFPNFLVAMGIKTMPTAESFTKFLRGCINDSMVKGYSKNPLTIREAYALRRAKEPDVEVRPGLTRMLIVDMSRKTFFPEAGRGRGVHGFQHGDREGRGRGHR